MLSILLVLVFLRICIMALLATLKLVGFEKENFFSLPEVYQLHCKLVLFKCSSNLSPFDCNLVFDFKEQDYRSNCDSHTPKQNGQKQVGRAQGFLIAVGGSVLPRKELNIFWGNSLGHFPGLIMCQPYPSSQYGASTSCCCAQASRTQKFV